MTTKTKLGAILVVEMESILLHKVLLPKSLFGLNSGPPKLAIPRARPTQCFGFLIHFVSSSYKGHEGRMVAGERQPPSYPL